MLTRPIVEPSGLPSVFRLPDGTCVRVRSIQAQDSDRLQAYLRGLSTTSRRNRLFGAVSQLASAVLDRILRLDGPDGSAWLAFPDRRDDTIIAEAMHLIAPDGAGCEIAMSVADAWQRRGLGTLLLRDIESRARMSGAGRVFGHVLRTNTAMKRLAHKEGFSLRAHTADPALIEVVKEMAVAACSRAASQGASLIGTRR